MIEKNVEKNAQNLSNSTVNKIESVLCTVKKIPENMTYFLENTAFTKKETLNLIRMIVKNNKEIYGSTISFEPYAFDKNSLYFAPYCYKKDNKIEFSYLGSDSYRYFYLDWYQIPRELNCPQWSEPYIDVGGGNILMSTYSVPFYEEILGKRKLKGIVTVDISIEWLREIISSMKILNSGYTFLITKNGTMVTHPIKEFIMNETIFSIAEARKEQNLREIGRKMIKGESGFVPFKDVETGKQYRMYYTPIPSTGWSLAVLFPLDEFMADIFRLNYILALLGVVGLTLLIIGIVLISKSITKPLHAMAVATEAIGKGNLDIELPPAQLGDEVGKLTESFRYMKKSLKEYIQKLTETTAAKERIESDLRIASEIQASMLPRIFPPFPDRKEFDIFAVMEPAKEVGGDFYDFFFVDTNKFCFLIGDVSGKGVPAALFMAILKTLIKMEAQRGFSPAEVFSRINNSIVTENETSMFATLFCVLLDIETGEVEYSNAGHNPPFICTASNGVKYVDVPKGFVVGPMPGIKFENKKMILKSGDAFFLYTDGVTEAMNPEEQMFSEKRLKDTLDKLKEKKTEDIIHAIREDIKLFVKESIQSDDITMLALRFKGKAD